LLLYLDIGLKFGLNLFNITQHNTTHVQLYIQINMLKRLLYCCSLFLIICTFKNKLSY